MTTAIPNLTYAYVDGLLSAIPEGRYALPRKNPSPNGSDLTFFEVRKRRNHPALRHMIVQLVGSTGDYERKPLRLQFQYFAALHILEDVRAAAALYGKKSKACGFCAAKGRHSPLTHPRSLIAGYGKDCAENHGLPW